MSRLVSIALLALALAVPVAVAAPGGELEDAVALVENGEWQAAERELRRLLAEGENPEARELLGVVLGNQGDIDGAKQQFDQALAVDPSHVGARQPLDAVDDRPRLVDRRVGEMMLQRRRDLDAQAQRHAHLQLAAALEADAAAAEVERPGRLAKTALRLVSTPNLDRKAQGKASLARQQLGHAFLRVRVRAASGSVNPISGALARR